MRVACVAVPHFLVEIERRHDPSLRGRPVVVGGANGVSGFGFRVPSQNPKLETRNPKLARRVLDCSPEAMARGIRPGMTLREALSRCADAAFVEAHPERYQAAMQAMVEALLEVSLLVEPAGPGVIYVGLDRPW